jgi:hypothetical protein
LHAGTDAVVIILCLNQRDGDVRLVVENVVGKLGFATGDESAADDDPSLREVDLLANLRQVIPPRLFDGGVMNLVQMSRSLSDFLFAESI